jgi:hypothetical protein
MDELLEGESRPTPNTLRFYNVAFSNALMPRLQYRFDNLDIQALKVWNCTFATTRAFRTFLRMVSSNERLAALDLNLSPREGLRLLQLELLVESLETGALSGLSFNWNGPYEESERVRQAFRRVAQIPTNVLSVELMPSPEVLAEYAPLLRGLQDGWSLQSSAQRNVGLSVDFGNHENLAAWNSFVTRVCETTGIHSLRVKGFILDNESSGSLTRLISESGLGYIFFKDYMVVPSIEGQRIQELTIALARNTTLQFLALQAVEDSGLLLPAVFATLPAMRHLRDFWFAGRQDDHSLGLLLAFAKRLPMLNVRSLQTRWCPGLVEILEQGLRQNMFLTKITFGGLMGGDQPSDEEIEPLTRLLDRNRRYRQVF